MSYGGSLRTFSLIISGRNKMASHGELLRAYEVWVGRGVGMKQEARQVAATRGDGRRLLIVVVEQTATVSWIDIRLLLFTTVAF